MRPSTAPLASDLASRRSRRRAPGERRGIARPRINTVPLAALIKRLGHAALSTAIVATLPLLSACSLGEPTAAPTPIPAEHAPTVMATIEHSPTPTPSYEDPYEPNDSMLQVSDRLVLGQEYRGFISKKDDIDFFSFEIETPQTVVLSLTDIPPETDYDLYLVTGEEDILGDSSHPGHQDEYIEYTTSSVGVFYVLVLPFENFSPTETYTLRLELSPAPTPSGQDSYEPNDTPEQATGPLALGQTYQSYIWDEGDVDVYTFGIDQPLIVQISLTHITAVADYDLFLSNEAGELLASSTRAIDRETIELSLQPGTYYVTVESFSGFSQNEPYSVQVNSVRP